MADDTSLNEAANAVLLAWGPNDPDRLSAPQKAALELARAYARSKEPPPDWTGQLQSAVSTAVQTAKHAALTKAAEQCEKRATLYRQRNQPGDAVLARESHSCATVIRALSSNGDMS